ncbi:MAG: GNAT family N-acetyltransferase [Paracoccaceae bacterium]
MFDGFSTTQPAPLQQSQAFADALTRLDTFWQWVDYGCGKALMQARIMPWGGWVGLISRGPVVDHAFEPKTFFDALATQGHPILINADGLKPDDLRDAGCVPVMSPATLALLHLDRDENAQIARMHQKWRNRWRKAAQSRLQLSQQTLPEDRLHWLITAETEQRNSKAYKGLPAELATAYTMENPGEAQLFTASHAGKPIGGMIFLRHGAMATYFIGHTCDQGRALGAHNLLIMKAARYFAARGVQMLDLGTLNTDNAPGLARFKLGCGAKPHVLGGTWLYSRRLARLLRRR